MLTLCATVRLSRQSNPPMPTLLINKVSIEVSITLCSFSKQIKFNERVLYLKLAPYLHKIMPQSDKTTDTRLSAIDRWRNFSFFFSFTIGQKTILKLSEKSLIRTKGVIFLHPCRHMPNNKRSIFCV